MRFLADMGVSGSTLAALRERGHDAVHLRERGLERLDDAGIIELATREGRVLLTFDLDFGDLLAAAGTSLPSVIVFRLRNQTPAAVTPRLLDVLGQRERELASGAVVVVEEARYRLRRLPIEGGQGAPRAP